MKNILYSLILVIFITSGCTSSEVEPTQNMLIELTSIVPTTEATATQIPPTDDPPSPMALAIEAARPVPGTVALDFVALACSATWSSSIVFTACPGDPNDLSNGYIEPLLQAELESGESVDLPALLTIPPQADSQYGGIFGRYRSFTVQPGDRFRALITCQRAPCGEVEYALDTYDANGVFHGYPLNLPNPFKEYAESGFHFAVIDLSLDYLVGQTVDLVLVVRDQSYLQGDRYLWIAPHIYRDPRNTSATPLPPIGNMHGYGESETASLNLPMGAVLSTMDKPRILTRVLL